MNSISEEYGQPAPKVAVKSSPVKSGPRIGVLIPVYNEEPVINDTIDSLLAASFHVADIFIVNDRSTDRTAELAAARGVNVFTVPVNGGKAKAQIAALEHCKLLERYDWLVFLDGDTKIDKNFLKEMTKAALADPSVALYLGQVKSAKNDHIYSASRAFDYTYGQEIAKTGQHNFNVVFVAPGCASMYSTLALKDLQIDHETLAEDMDLTMQVHRMGGRVAYVPKAIVHTQDPATFKDYHKQILRWYRGFWQVMRKHKVFNPFVRKQRVDWYMLALIGDAVFFNRLLWLIFLATYSPSSLPWAISIDLTIAGAICLWVAWATKRLDVIWKFPAYYWITYLNFYAYMRSFVEVIVLKKDKFGWNKVKRYNFDDSKKAVTKADPTTVY